MTKNVLRKIYMACSAVAVTGIAPGYVLAADAPADAPPAGNKLSQLLDEVGVSVAGYVSASYYHSTGLSTFHQFDVEHDTFQLDQAAVTIGYQPKEGFGALVNLTAGEDARVLNNAENGTNSTFNATQAYLQYATGPLTVIAGKYVTLAGAEVIDPTKNTQFSRSLLFFTEPLTHTGVRATLAATDTLNLIVGVNNGWNSTSTSFGSKTAEVGLAFTPNKIFAVTAQAYIGKDPTFNATRTLVDGVITWTATSVLSVAVNANWGKQQQQSVAGLSQPDLDWYTLAGYVNFALNDQWRLSLRGEYLDDKQGFIGATSTAEGVVLGPTEKIKEGTVTLGYSPVKSFELRFEGRYDWSDQQSFVSTVNGDPVAVSHQTGIAIQGLYKF
jgi:Putative beta-barrel porin-2, OmpL-like. bbp2